MPSHKRERLLELPRADQTCRHMVHIASRKSQVRHLLDLMQLSRSGGPAGTRSQLTSTDRGHPPSSGQLHGGQKDYLNQSQQCSAPKRLKQAEKAVVYRVWL